MRKFLFAVEIQITQYIGINLTEDCWHTLFYWKISFYQEYKGILKANKCCRGILNTNWCI